jgi:hypothetical protein
MHPELADPELSRQIFDNALAATAWSFIALALVAAILVAIYITWECLRLTREPARPECQRRGWSRSRVETPAPVEVIHEYVNGTR